MQHRQRPYICITQRGLATDGPQVKRFRAGDARGAGKAAGLQGVGEHLQGKAAAVRHEQIAGIHGTAVAVHDVQRRDWAGV